MLVAPFVTTFARKYKTQPTMMIGAILIATGFISASFARKVWELYLSQGALVGFGVGFVWIPSIAILPQWFERRRSLANGIASAGSGVSGLVFSFVTQAMITKLSLAWSLRITGIICGVMNLISALLMRNRNKIIKPAQRGFDTKLLRRYDVLLLLAWAFISMLGYITLLFSLSDFARSIGLSVSQAASVSAFLNLGTAVGRPFIGVLSDRCGRLETAGVITLLCGITCFAIWLPANSYGVTVFFAIVNGAILGVFWMVSRDASCLFVCMLLPGRCVSSAKYKLQTVGPISAEVAGLVELPSLLSLCWMSIVLPTTCKTEDKIYL